MDNFIDLNRHIEFLPETFINELPRLSSILEIKTPIPSLVDFFDTLEKDPESHYNLFKHWLKNTLIKWEEILVQSEMFEPDETGILLYLIVLIKDLVTTDSCDCIETLMDMIIKRTQNSYSDFMEHGWHFLIFKLNNAKSEDEEEQDNKSHEAPTSEEVIPEQFLRHRSFSKPQCKQYYQSAQESVIRSSTLLKRASESQVAEYNAKEQQKMEPIIEEPEAEPEPEETLLSSEFIKFKDQLEILYGIVRNNFSTHYHFQLLKQSMNNTFNWEFHIGTHQLHLPKNFWTNKEKIKKKPMVTFSEIEMDIDADELLKMEQKLYILPLQTAVNVDDRHWRMWFGDKLDEFYQENEQQ